MKRKIFGVITIISVVCLCCCTKTSENNDSKTINEITEKSNYERYVDKYLDGSLTEADISFLQDEHDEFSNKMIERVESCREVRCHIKEVDYSIGSICYDDFEIIDSEDAEKTKELGLSEEDFINGMYEYNESEEVIQANISDNTKLRRSFSNGCPYEVEDNISNLHKVSEEEEVLLFINDYNEVIYISVMPGA